MEPKYFPFPFVLYRSHLDRMNSRVTYVNVPPTLFPHYLSPNEGSDVPIWGPEWPFCHSTYWLCKGHMASNLHFLSNSPRLSTWSLSSHHTGRLILLWPILLAHPWCLCQKFWARAASLHACSKSLTKCYILENISYVWARVLAICSSLFSQHLARALTMIILYFSSGFFSLCYSRCFMYFLMVLKPSMVEIMKQGGTVWNG